MCDDTKTETLGHKVHFSGQFLQKMLIFKDKGHSINMSSQELNMPFFSSLYFFCKTMVKLARIHIAVLKITAKTQIFPNLKIRKMAGSDYPYRGVWLIKLTLTC